MVVRFDEAQFVFLDDDRILSAINICKHNLLKYADRIAVHLLRLSLSFLSFSIAICFCDAGMGFPFSMRHFATTF